MAPLIPEEVVAAPPRLYEWLSIRRGDSIPDNAVMAGQTKTDGKLYVAKCGNECGKLNTSDGTMWNIWTYTGNDKQSGEILVETGGTCEWVKVRTGGAIPSSAISVGQNSAGAECYPCRAIKSTEVGNLTTENGKVCGMAYHGKKAIVWGMNSDRKDKKEAEILCVNKQGLSREQVALEMTLMLAMLEKSDLSLRGREATANMRRELEKVKASFDDHNEGDAESSEVDKQTTAGKFHRLVNVAKVQKDYGLSPALNELISLLWPRIETFIRNMVQDSIEPSINDALPTMAKGSVKFTKMNLGKSSPKLEPIFVEHSEDSGDIQLHIGINFTSELEVEITAMKVPITISSFFLKGDLKVLLSPPMLTPPFFGGMQLFFPDPPEIGFDLGGLAKAGEVPGIRQAIRGAIDSAVSGICVLPRRIAVDMNDDDDVDIVDLTYPEPLAILRLTLFSGSNLIASDTNLIGAATSDPYVVATLGIKTWTSPVIKKNLSPVWGEDGAGLIVDLPVHSDTQSLLLKVYDYDFGSSDDLIGVAHRTPVRDLALKNGKHTMDLLTAEGETGGGFLTISTQLFTLTTQAPSAPLKSAGLAVANLAVKLNAMEGLDPKDPSVAAYPYTISVQVMKDSELQASSQASSRKSFTFSRSKSEELILAEACSTASTIAEQKQLAEAYHGIVRELVSVFNDLSEKHCVEKIAGILGVGNYQVRQYLKNSKKNILDAKGLKEFEEEQEKHIRVRNIKKPKFDQVLHLLLPEDAMASGTVMLTLRDKKQVVLGSAVVTMQQIVETENLELEGPFPVDELDKTFIIGSMRLKYLDVHSGSLMTA